LLPTIRHERLVEIFVELGEPGFHVEWLVERLQEHSPPDASHADLSARHAKFLRKAHGLAAAIPEKLGDSSSAHE